MTAVESQGMASDASRRRALLLMARQRLQSIRGEEADLKAARDAALAATAAAQVTSARERGAFEQLELQCSVLHDEIGTVPPAAWDMPADESTSEEQLSQLKAYLKRLQVGRRCLQREVGLTSALQGLAVSHRALQVTAEEAQRESAAMHASVEGIREAAELAAANALQSLEDARRDAESALGKLRHVEQRRYFLQHQLHSLAASLDEAVEAAQGKPAAPPQQRPHALSTVLHGDPENDAPAARARVLQTQIELLRDTMATDELLDEAKCRAGSVQVLRDEITAVEKELGTADTVDALWLRWQQLETSVEVLASELVLCEADAALLTSNASGVERVLVDGGGESLLETRCRELEMAAAASETVTIPALRAGLQRLTEDIVDSGVADRMWSEEKSRYDGLQASLQSEAASCEKRVAALRSQRDALRKTLETPAGGAAENDCLCIAVGNDESWALANGPNAPSIGPNAARSSRSPAVARMFAVENPTSLRFFASRMFNDFVSFWISRKKKRAPFMLTV